MNKRELEKRKTEMTARARVEIAKTEIVQFRLDPGNILKLYELAEKAKKPLGAMIRDWALERMQLERGGATASAKIHKLERRMNALEKKVAHKA
jgi:chromosome segregation ATPase